MFKYTTVHRLRQEGFKQKELPFAKALLLIEEASDLLSDALGQWYVPHRTTKRLDGGGSSIIYFPNRIPFLEVLSMAELFTADVTGRELPRRIDILVGSADRTSYNSDEYIIRGRLLELLFTNAYPGRGNVEVDTYTGFLDWFGIDSRNTTIRKVIGELKTAMSQDAVEAELVSSAGFEDRDVLLFETNDTARTLLATAISNQVTHSTSKIAVDKIQTLNGAQMPIGTKVITFGKVPSLIERATILIVKKLNVQMGSDEYDEAVFSSKLKGEKTDRYSYTLFGQKEGGGVGLTGDPLVDSQLHRFAEPNFVDFA